MEELTLQLSRLNVENPADPIVKLLQNGILNVFNEDTAINSQTVADFFGLNEEIMFLDELNNLEPLSFEDYHAILGQPQTMYTDMPPVRCTCNRLTRTDLREKYYARVIWRRNFLRSGEYAVQEAELLESFQKFRENVQVNFGTPLEQQALLILFTQQYEIPLGSDLSKLIQRVRKFWNLPPLEPKDIESESADITTVAAYLETSANAKKFDDSIQLSLRTGSHIGEYAMASLVLEQVLFSTIYRQSVALFRKAIDRLPMFSSYTTEATAEFSSEAEALLAELLEAQKSKDPAIGSILQKYRHVLELASSDFLSTFKSASPYRAQVLRRMFNDFLTTLRIPKDYPHQENEIRGFKAKQWIINPKLALPFTGDDINAWISIYESVYIDMLNRPMRHLNILGTEEIHLCCRNYIMDTPKISTLQVYSSAPRNEKDPRITREYIISKERKAREIDYSTLGDQPVEKAIIDSSLM